MYLMFTGCVCKFVYILQGGVFVLQLMDTYAASWSVFLLAILECLVISYIYGKRTLLDTHTSIPARELHPESAQHIFYQEVIRPSLSRETLQARVATS